MKNNSNRAMDKGCRSVGHSFRYHRSGILILLITDCNIIDKLEGCRSVGHSSRYPRSGRLILVCWPSTLFTKDVVVWDTLPSPPIRFKFEHKFRVCQECCCLSSLSASGCQLLGRRIRWRWMLRNILIRRILMHIIS